MDSNPPQTSFGQPRLFKAGADSARIMELFPTLWSNLEDLSSPDVLTRQKALVSLENSGAARISPLVIYTLATCLTDPDVGIRVQVIKALGNVLAPDAQGNLSVEAVIDHLTFYLSRMRTRQVFSMIQALADNPDLAPQVVRLLLACPFAGNHLVEIAHSRKVSLEIRNTAIWLIGEVGYVEAIPALERLQIRMESRLNGQQAMPFAPPLGIDDSGLLPGLKNALSLLRSP